VKAIAAAGQEVWVWATDQLMPPLMPASLQSDQLNVSFTLKPAR